MSEICIGIIIFLPVARAVAAAATRGGVINNRTMAAVGAGAMAEQFSTPNWISLPTRDVSAGSSEPGSPVIFTDQWAVHVTGGVEKARELAGVYGFDFVNEVSVSVFF